MSLAARASLCNRLIFQNPSQRADLLDPSKTQTELIALLIGLVDRGHYIEITAVRADHSDDSALGLHCHANGYAADCWPLASFTAGDYLDAASQQFRGFLQDASDSAWLWQIGLAGTADTPANQQAAGRTAFSDDGADHVHLSGNGP